jgi:hypothetical protein
MERLVCITNKHPMVGMVLQSEEYYNKFNPNDDASKPDQYIIDAFGTMLIK